MMSGTRVSTMSAPLMAPMSRPSEQNADGDDDAELVALALHQRCRDDVGQGHHRADRQVDSARDDDDRLGNGGQRERQHVMASPWMPVAP